MYACAHAHTERTHGTGTHLRPARSAPVHVAPKADGLDLHELEATLRRARAPRARAAVQRAPARIDALAVEAASVVERRVRAREPRAALARHHPLAALEVGACVHGPPDDVLLCDGVRALRAAPAARAGPRARGGAEDLCGVPIAQLVCPRGGAARHAQRQPIGLDPVDQADPAAHRRPCTAPRAAAPCARGFRAGIASQSLLCCQATNAPTVPDRPSGKARSRARVRLHALAAGRAGARSRRGVAIGYHTEAGLAVER